MAQKKRLSKMNEIPEEKGKNEKRKKQKKEGGEEQERRRKRKEEERLRIPKMDEIFNNQKQK